MVLKRLAVTGASGMVGWHLIEACSAKGISCQATSRRRPKTLPPQSSWSPWDLQEWKTNEEFDQLFPGVDALIHLGAMLPARGANPVDPLMFEVNVRATLGLGLWALHRGIPMVFISSSTVYADVDRDGIKEEDPKVERGMAGFYGFSKRLGEEILQYLALEGLKVCIFRPSAIYGYGLPEDKMVTHFLREAGRNHSIEVSAPADDKVNLVHADDLAHAILSALEKGALGIFNIAGEGTPTIRDVARTCVEVVGRGRLNVASSPAKREPRVRFGLNCKAARKAFGFSPHIDLRTGIQKMWEAISRLDLQEVEVRR